MGGESSWDFLIHVWNGHNQFFYDKEKRNTAATNQPPIKFAWTDLASRGNFNFNFNKAWGYRNVTSGYQTVNRIFYEPINNRHFQ